jgi:two-component system probable response regulator PhcQ
MDMEAAINAVNSGGIYKYVNKPWNPTELEVTLKRGLEFFLVQRERDELLKEKMSVLHNMIIADRIISLGFLAAGLSHHIRNALVAVKTFLDLAPVKMQEEKVSAEGLRHPEFWKEYYQNVQGQIQKINGMLKDLGSASEEFSSQFTDEVNLRQVICDAESALREPLAARKIRIDNMVPESLPAMKVDNAKFCRLFELLLKDEIVSLPPESTVRFSAEVAQDSMVPNSEIEVRIQDDGPGLDKEALRLLFDPFVLRTESPMEYGINLMACYFIVHHHGGRIRAEAAEGRGTLFTLRLPTNSRQPPATFGTSDFPRKVSLNDALWEKLAAG